MSKNTPGKAMPQWLIYGVTGYTGQRVARAAKAAGLSPILAGRDPARVRALADELSLPHRAFALDDPAATRAGLADVSVVAHCAGPFVHTSAPMIDACLATHTHYVDITGEMDVFIAAHARDAAARAAGIVLLPGAGFDVIPTDCLAAVLKESLPDATHLMLGFTGLDDLSPGTARSAIAAMETTRGSRVRRDGTIVPVPYFSHARTIDFMDGKAPVAAFNLPWGDVATAYYSTGIANIATYVPASSGLARTVRQLRPVMPLMRFAAMRRLASAAAPLLNRGPSASDYEQAVSHVVGEVANARGEIRGAHLSCPNGYRLTADGVLMAVRHLLANSGTSGYTTPSALLGSRCIEQLPGASRIVVEPVPYHQH